MAYWKPGQFNTVANRRRQWALIGALTPDIALLQECRPTDLVLHGPGWMAAEYDIVGAIPHRWTACSVVLARRSLGLIELERSNLPVDEQRWLEYLAGYVTTAWVTLEDRQVAVASVHAIAKAVDSDAVTDVDHGRIRRQVLQRAWHNDLVVAALTPWIDAHPFIIGGDWNNAKLFDTIYPTGAEGGPGASTEFFAARSSSGWHHALRKFHRDEQRTYLDPGSAAYELDHIFTDTQLHERLRSCDVVNEAALAELSDHAPLIAEFSAVTADGDATCAGESLRSDLR
jgi:exonuclease III